MKQGSYFNSLGNQKTFRFISYTLVFLMMACFAMTIGILIRNAVPDWSSDVISGITLFIVLDRLYTFKRMKLLIPFSRDWAVTVGAQWIVVVVFIRILLSYANGYDALITDISLFSRGYLVNLLNMEFVVTLFLALLAWHISGQFLGLLDEIGLDQTPVLLEGSIPGRKVFLPAHQRLINLTLQMGISLVILTASTRLDMKETFNLDGSIRILSRFSGGEAGALFYFIFGFALLCLSRLISLQTRWNQEHIPVAANDLNRQWGAYSFFFILILVVVVGLLSSGENLGMFSMLGILFAFLARIFFFLVTLILFLLAFLFSIPSIFFGSNILVNRVLPPTPTPLPPDPVEDPALSLNNPILALIRSIVLWGSLIVILGFSVARFVRYHGGLEATFRKIPIANWLFFAWQWLSTNAERTRRTLSSTIAEVWQRIVSRPGGKGIFARPAWIGLRSLDPRRQIYFFYLAMIRRGSDQGMTRTPSQTPSEYADVLEDALPPLNEDIHLITESFMEARYSRHDIDSQKANLVKLAWKRLRHALQMAGNPSNDPSDTKS